MELLSVENVTFRYPKASVDALQEVSLTVSEGQWAVVCGLSGCGKSTLLRMIKREIAPFGDFHGTVRFDGHIVRSEDSSLPVLGDREAAAGIGIVLQDPESQIVTDTVWHELAFGLENLGLPSEVIRRRVAEMSAFFGIEDWYHSKTYELSGGQKQLLNLASALVMNPRLLLLDEPTAQLDPIAAAEFRNVLRRVCSDLGVTILMAEHRLEDILPHADRIFLMDGGRILCSGGAAELTDHLHMHSHPMAEALPAATRIYLALTGGPAASGETASAGGVATASLPLTVRDGRAMLRAMLPKPAASQPATAPSADTDATVALEAKGLRFRYDRTLPDVLSEASIAIRAGEHYCLLGGNGSGKTTLLSLLAGLTKPYAGTVRLFDRKLSSFAPGTLYRGNLALLPQQPRDVFTETTIRADLLKAFSRVDQDNAESSMLALCERLRITGILDSHPYDVSGGELQKAALAKVLASRPKVLLLDEPAKGIDVRGKGELAGLLRDLQNDGVAVLSVTHDAEWAALHADRCGLLFDGTVISEADPKAFFEGNAFYTTAANRMARGIIDGAITCDDVVAAVRGRASGEVSS